MDSWTSGVGHWAGTAVGALVLLAPAGASGQARDEGLRRALIERRVLSPRELERADAAVARVEGEGAREEGLPAAGWDSKKKRPFLQTPDGRFRIEPRLRIQLRWNSFFREKSRGGSSREEFSDKDRHFGEARRARLKFSGHFFDPRLTYYLQAGADSKSSGAAKLLDALIRYKVDAALRVGAGQFKPYFLRQEATSSAKLQLVERSLANEFFNIDRGVGAWIEGELAGGRIFYALSIVNGFDSVNEPFGEIDASPAYAAKLDFDILGHYGYGECDVGWSEEPSLVVGLSYAFDDQNRSGDAPDEPMLQVHAGGIDAGLKWRGFSLQAEYMGRFVDLSRYTSGGNRFTAPSERDAVYSHGFYAQVGCFVLPRRLELVFRASAVFNDEGSLRSDAWEVGPGLNVFLYGHNLKFSGDCMWVDIGPDFPNSTENLDYAPGRGLTSPLLESPNQGIRVRLQAQLDF